jgi:ligand-binding sensor domain-containing protein
MVQMITSYKGRSIDSDKKVKVYRNLNNGKLSVMQNGLVVAHADSITLLAADFQVNRKARARVLKEGRKNVHAFVVGYYANNLFFGQGSVYDVSYNPYRFPYFYDKESLNPVNRSTIAVINSAGKILVQGVKW